MTAISSHELRDKYQNFFEAHGHKRITGSSLVPENDPSVLFITAGMHPLVPYLQGQPHPLGRRLTGVQRCLRTTDVEAVGDATHATVFEMLGNWSLGDYGKEEAIKLSWDFLTDRAGLGIKPEKLAVSVFAGDDNSPCDTESAKWWQLAGLPAERIVFLDNHENWWPAGGQASGPQGPDTEMFYWTGDVPAPTVFDPSDTRWVEIWNDVFMEFNRTASGRLESLRQRNVDTGMGLERTVMALNGCPSIYEIDISLPLLRWLNEGGNLKQSDSTERNVRILADHIKAATFIMTDENSVQPSKTEQGYVLRRLIRRAVIKARTMDMVNYVNLFQQGMEIVVQQYEGVYGQMRKNLVRAQAGAEQEIMKFEGSLHRGMRMFNMVEKNSPVKISGADLALLWQSYGFPVEITSELAEERGKTVDRQGWHREYTAHQKKSRAGAGRKFKGGLADQSVKSMQYHTATHLLQAALRELLGEQVVQQGSNITAERLRFDFNCDHKLTRGELALIEAKVNQVISGRLPVERLEMGVGEAIELGALGLFKQKYGEKVSVYRIGDISLEICGGPHVKNTGELGRFKIIKEEASAAGVRRIKAVLE